MPQVTVHGKVQRVVAGSTIGWVGSLYGFIDPRDPYEGRGWCREKYFHSVEEACAYASEQYTTPVVIEF